MIRGDDAPEKATGPAPGDAPDGPASETDYATRVEDAFIAERGTPFLLSPKDWQLIRGFYERGVPADTVVRAVHDAFERRRARGAAGKVSSFAYCADAVEERWQMERRGLVGKGDGTRDAAPEAAAPRLARLLAALRDAATRAGGAPQEAHEAASAAPLAKAVAKLEALDPAAPFDDVEDALKRVEVSLAAALKKALSEEGRAALQATVRDLLGDTGDLAEAARERMRRALERRELRRLFGVPPLTLFDA